MSTFMQKIQFGFVKKQILNSKTDSNIRWDLARNLARTHCDLFMADPQLLSVMYSNLKDSETLEHSSLILFEIFNQYPKKSIGQKNLMVAVRRIAIDGHNELSQKAVQLLLEKNDLKSCLGSKYFMEVLECIASFDEDGTVTRMLDDLEAKLPVETEHSESFARARANNIESLTKQDLDVEIDLSSLHDDDENANKNESAKSQKDLQLAPNDKLWAGPLE